jgi:hypothetical protein
MPPILFLVTDDAEARRINALGLKAVAATKTANMIGVVLNYDIAAVIVSTRSILDDPEPPLVRYCDNIHVVAEWNLRDAQTREQLIAIAVGEEVPVAAAAAAA